MSSSLRTRFRTKVLISALIGAFAAALAAIAVPSGPASAHGNVTGPASRNYSCYERWGSKFQDPTMATLDPMCWQAWQADPNAMWNWNGLFREGVAGNHQAAIPDGQLCSGGRTQNGRYNAMDTVGDWKTTTVNQQFTLTLTDEAQHGATYLLIYVTRDGYDPASQPLTWADLELVTKTGRYGSAPKYQAQVDLGNRTGRRVLYTIWQAAHADQPYFLCSDIVVNGNGTQPTTTSVPATTADPGITSS